MLPESFGTRVERIAYRAHRAAALVPSMAGQRLLRVLSGKERLVLSHDQIRAIERRYDALLEVDLADCHAGHYPRALLFDPQRKQILRTAPEFVLDLPRVLRRRRRADFRLGRNASTLRERYPAYFRRTFHWQSGGYLSEHSARIYDLSVEFLFLGTANVMRRRALAPLARELAARKPDAEPMRVLDVACGTGPLLAQLAFAMPELALTGLDLSPQYLGEAQRRLQGHEVSWVAQNAETMPFRDGWFDAVTNVFLMHELPRAVRRRVAAEMFRVIAPGGLLVCIDSAQLVESPELAPFLARFPEEFHEPFFDDYVRDDLGDVLRGAGFVVERVDPAFVSKVVLARKPSAASD